MGRHGGTDGPRRRRVGLRAAVAAVVVLVAGVVLAGVGTAATPLLRAPADAVVGSLLGGPGGGAEPGDAPLITPPVPPVPPCLPTVRACVDLTSEHAWLLDKGRVVRGPVPIAPGDEESPTPLGLFSVQWKAAEYTSREFLVQMPWSVFFADGGIAFHQGDLGSPSAGCVKLDPEDARAFFEFLQVGDSVQLL